MNFSHEKFVSTTIDRHKWPCCLKIAHREFLNIKALRLLQLGIEPRSLDRSFWLCKEEGLALTSESLKLEQCIKWNARVALNVRTKLKPFS